MEFRITKEQILKLSESGGADVSLYLKKEFPEAFKTELVVGRWYKIDNGPHYLLNFQKKLGPNNYGFVGGKWGND